MNHPALLLLPWCVFALLSGRMEGKTSGVIDHRALTALRAVSLVLLAAAVRVPWSWYSLLILPACMAAFAVLHRAAFNLTRRQPLHYMGPSTRTRNTSAYDELWWMLTAVSVQTTNAGRSRHYVLRKASDPWLAASIFEVLMAIASIIAINLAQP